MVAFPSYEFANEEFPTCKKIKDFVAGYKGEHLKLMEPVKVNGPEASPVWKFLKDPATCASCAGEVEWNFAACECQRRCREGEGGLTRGRSQGSWSTAAEPWWSGSRAIRRPRSR